MMQYIMNKALWFSRQSDYLPADFSAFVQEGNVYVGSCKAESPLLNITKKSARHAEITSGINREFNNNNVSDKRLPLPAVVTYLPPLKVEVLVCVLQKRRTHKMFS